MNIDDSEGLNKSGRKVQPEKYKKAHFFIRDLFNAEKLENECFQFKNILFGFVLICGTIVSVSPKGEDEEKYWLNGKSNNSPLTVQLIFFFFFQLMMEHVVFNVLYQKTLTIF